MQIEAMEKSIDDARTGLRNALYDIEDMMEEALETHHVSVARNITLKRTLKSVQRHLLDAVDARAMPDQPAP